MQAVDVSLATAAMPGRVAKIEGITRALEQGSLKLRVRDPASERALRRSSIMQVGKLNCLANSPLTQNNKGLKTRAAVLSSSFKLKCLGPSRLAKC